MRTSPHDAVMSVMTRANDPLKSVEAVSAAIAAAVPGVGISEAWSRYVNVNVRRACARSRARRVAEEGDRALETLKGRKPKWI